MSLNENNISKDDRYQDELISGHAEQELQI